MLFLGIGSRNDSIQKALPLPARVIPCSRWNSRCFYRHSRFVETELHLTFVVVVLVQPLEWRSAHDRDMHDVNLCCKSLQRSAAKQYDTMLKPHVKMASDASVYDLIFFLDCRKRDRGPSCRVWSSHATTICSFSRISKGFKLMKGLHNV